ncbi:MAG: Mov34/MPN/PAD-1 family protein [Acidobacteriota bacterium]
MSGFEPMSGHYRYTLELFRPDGSSVGQVALDRALAVDWTPAEEWVRFLALCRDGSAAGASGEASTAIEPVWHTTLGQPYVEAFRVRFAGVAGESSEQFGTSYLKREAELATAYFVSKDAVAKGDRVVYVAAAYPCQPPPDLTEGLELSAEDVSGPPVLGEGRLEQFPHGPVRGPAEAGDMAVLMPERVLDEAATLARGADERETGGVLVGRLWRDSGARQVIAEVTAQVPARHTEATASRLTFTHDTWTDVRAAIALRRRDEVMLGWWHSHPVRVWCRECSPEKQAVCPLAEGFFSEHDRALHRTMFPSAYSLGLLVNDLTSGPTFSLFGWRRGLIAPRGFAVLGATRNVAVSGSVQAMTECGKSVGRHEEDVQYRTA